MDQHARTQGDQPVSPIFRSELSKRKDAGAYRPSAGGLRRAQSAERAADAQARQSEQEEVTMDRKPQFHLESAGNGRTKVVENSTGLIWRTLDSRPAAADGMSQADPPPADRKVKTR